MRPIATFSFSCSRLMNALHSPLDFNCVHAFFMQAARAVPEREFNCVPWETAAIYGIEAGETTYATMAAGVSRRRATFAANGYGKGHRVGLLLENRPVFFEIWFALNALGVSIVPIGPDLRAAELTYLIEHSEMCLAISIADRQEALRDAGKEVGLPVMGPGETPSKAQSPASEDPVRQTDEAALLYTSGTTGTPKGCVLSNRYFLNCGRWYSTIGGHCRLRFDGERMLTPLPLFHMNALACSTMAMIAVGGALIVLDRFRPDTWWKNVRDARATVVHYLGVMPAMLMNTPVTGVETDNDVRFGFGAGVDKKLHGPFENRFGFPLIEGWAMTETGNGGITVASHGNRHVGASNIGRPTGEVALRVVTDDDREADVREPGELLVRSKRDDPRFGFFDRYLKDEKATAEAWDGGWFHTGDIVSRIEDGTLVFVDRKKNVIRRSGENIAAVEVESVLGRHPAIDAVAVAATPDPVRGDEVFALIVRSGSQAGKDPVRIASEIVAWCLGRLAYYKAPGFICFVDEIPLTSTNKIQRGELKKLVAILRDDEATIDLRRLKRRNAA